MLILRSIRLINEILKIRKDKIYDHKKCNQYKYFRNYNYIIQHQKCILICLKFCSYRLVVPKPAAENEDIDPEDAPKIIDPRKTPQFAI